MRREISGDRWLGGTDRWIQFTIGVKFTIGVRPAILRFSIDQITGNGLRPRRSRVQTAALLCRFNLDVAEENRAACLHDLGGVNAAEDAINKTHSVNNC